MDRKAIAEYAVEHHGVFPQEYLSRVGVTPNTAARLVRSGEWQRLHEGVFIGATTPLSPEVRVTAALAAVPSAAIGLRTAAWVHGLSDGFSVLDLVVSVGGRTRLRGATIHQSALPDDDVVCRRGWRTTSLERTLIDLGKVESAGNLQRLMEDAVLTRRTTLSRIEAVFAARAACGRSGIARTRQVLEALDRSAPTGSVLEDRFLRMVRETGLPMPILQARFDWLDCGRARVDFWFPVARLIVELDGRRFHLRCAQFERDRRRDLLAAARGIRTIRLTHHQLTAERDEVVAALRAALASESRPSGAHLHR